MSHVELTIPDRLNLGRLGTPLQPLPGLSRRYGKNIMLWRDDLTGWALSGNKIRKLEFLCAEALAQGADHLVTCGGPQSNHARATAFAARQLGLNITVVVRKPPGGFEQGETPNGNLLLNRLLGACMEMVSFENFTDEGGVYEPFLERTARQLTRQGAKPYVIPEGGSCVTGCWGYFAALSELLQQTDGRPFDLFCAVGSGGTFAGLELGAGFSRGSARVHGVNVCDTAEYFQKRIGRLLDEFVATYPEYCEYRNPGPSNIYDGFVGAGYAIASDDDLRFYTEFVRETGVLLDPVYTGKAFRGMLRQLKDRPEDFLDDVIFLHSGGQFATFAFADQYQRVLG